MERNPVRAHMVRRAEDYRWSSAAAHCDDRPDPLLNQRPSWKKQLAQIEDWSAWLAEGDESEEIATLRRNADKGLPCGNESFIQTLEQQAGRPLTYRPQGRPKASGDRK